MRLRVGIRPNPQYPINKKVFYIYKTIQFLNILIIKRKKNL